ncbi:MAG: D-glycero-beta-D-manno-heptose 1,7-bisphosphate 7-phosphatase [Thiohalomonadaceae bacterium]
MQRVIILDRDGVINEDSDDYIKSPAEFIPIPGSLEAIVRLSEAGWRVLVATNQSGVARGLYDLATLQEIHAKLHKLLKPMGGQIEAIFYCPHAPDDDCACRKPKPGLLHSIAEQFQITLQGVPTVGDSLRDLQAAQAVGATPILVRTGKGERTLAEGTGLAGIPVYANLAAVVDALLT